MQKEELTILGSKEFVKNDELYKVVDFLNKTLKKRNLIFGLTSKGCNMSITIFEE